MASRKLCPVSLCDVLGDRQDSVEEEASKEKLTVKKRFHHSTKEMSTTKKRVLLSQHLQDSEAPEAERATDKLLPVKTPAATEGNAAQF